MAANRNRGLELIKFITYQNHNHAIHINTTQRVHSADNVPVHRSIWIRLYEIGGIVYN